MKRIIFFILFASIYLVSFSQVTHVPYYDTVYMENSKVKFERELRDSLPDGRYIVYFPCKNRDNEILKCSQIKQIATYKNYSKDGLFMSYEIDKGVHYLSCIENFKDGILEGNYICYNVLGEIILSGLYVNDKRNGEWMLNRKSTTYLIEYNMGVIKQWKQVDIKGNIITQGVGTPDFMLNLKNP